MPKEFAEPLGAHEFLRLRACASPSWPGVFPGVSIGGRWAAIYYYLLSGGAQKKRFFRGFDDGPDRTPLRPNDDDAAGLNSPATQAHQPAHAARTRARRSSNPARPYICRLIIFRRLTCPSTGPLLHGSVIPA